MSRALLIHNDNTPLKEIIENKIIFKPSIDDLNNCDLDRYISNEIIPQIRYIDFNIIYIKDALSENYMDFYGLVLAYHIRLSSELKNKKFVPIVILSEVSSHTINKLTSLGSILFTKNLFISENSLSTVEQFENLSLESLTDEQYEMFLNKVEIEPPKDYLSHHSITNEWGIYQWSHLLGVNTNSILNNRNKINSMLYFKYLVNKHCLTFKNEISSVIKSRSGRILLIDDKCEDGWHDILSTFMEKYYSDVKLESLGSGFKDIKNIEEIKEQVKTKIEIFNPDVVLLDLRLMEEADSFLKVDNDKEKSKHINKISGIQILKYLKNKTKTQCFNQGIQIIIFSASTDSLILDEVYKENILGYVKKDSPLNQYIATKSSLKKLKLLISGKGNALDRQYLKVIWQIQTEILNLNLNKFTTEERKPIEHEVKSVFEVLNSNIKNPFTYVMYSIFKCLELITNKFIEDRGIKSYWKYGDKSPLSLYIKDRSPLVGAINSDQNTKFMANKIHMLAFERFCLKDPAIHNQIDELVCTRNYSIHPEGSKNNNCKNKIMLEVKQEHIVVWFNLIHLFLEKLDSSERTAIV